MSHVSRMASAVLLALALSGCTASATTSIPLSCSSRLSPSRSSARSSQITTRTETPP